MGSSTSSNICNTLADTVFRRLQADIPGCCRLTVALSGGLDSVVLLHVLAGLRARSGYSLDAVHVHHGLSPNADSWADFCMRLCTKLDIPLRIVRVRVDPAKTGIEAAARKARYHAFAQSGSDTVALAHHLNDQIETFFLAALRGGGLQALSAMPSIRPLNDAIRVWRPLLDFTRTQLAAYADTCGLLHVEDESNSNTAFLRNRLRVQTLPRLYDQFPDADRHIRATVQRLQEDAAVLKEAVDADVATVTAAGYFDITEWRTLPPARRKRTLSEWASRLGFGMPRRVSADDFFRQIDNPATHRAEWPLPGGKIMVAGNALLPVADNLQQQPWRPLLPCTADDPALHHFVVRSADAAGTSVPDSGLFVRIARPGETVLMPYGHKKIKHLLREHGIPAALRDNWPLFCLHDSGACVAVAGITVTAPFREQGGTLPALTGLATAVTSVRP